MRLRLILILSLILSSAHAEPLKIQFWHSVNGDKAKLLKELTDDFNALPENSGKLSVKLQFVGSYEEGLNRLRTSLLAHRGPHVVQITDIGMQVMIDTGAVVPLQKFIDEDPEFPIKELLPPIRHYYEYAGKLYSLPFATSNPIVYCNANAFAKAHIDHPPRTFAELETTAAKLTDKAQKTTGLTWPLHSWFFEQFLAKQNALFADHENGRAGRAAQVYFTSPEAITFVSMWARMVARGTFFNVGRGWEPAEDNFLAERSAMLITTTADLFRILPQASFPVITAPLPAAVAGAKGGTIIGGNSLWILKRPVEAEEKAAYRFVKFMASKAVQRKWHIGTGYFPIREDVIRDLEAEGFYKKHPAARTAIEQLRNTPDTPATRGAILGVFPEAREHIHDAIEEILANKMDVVSALKKAKQETEAALSRYNRGRDAR